MKNNAPRGLYIHVPFCRKKCPYCDFYSLPFNQSKAEEYKNAVIRNLSRYENERFDTVYVGGGTPALIAEYIGEILSRANITENAEITAECNPDTLSADTLRILKQSGVNRLSFGVQSLCAEELSALGRTHTARTAADAVLQAEKAGFENISADIMLAVPNQTRETLAQTLTALCGLPITHVSAYLLKIEENTVFGRRYDEISAKLPDEDAQGALYLTAVELLEKHGFRQYEISNFAKAGYESRHNLKYWHAEEYVGIGPSAHSYYNGRRFFVPKSLEKFISDEFQTEQTLETSPDREEERIMLGLRLTDGIALTSKIQQRLQYIPREYYKISDGKLSLTPKGFLVSNEIIAVLLEK